MQTLPLPWSSLSVSCHWCIVNIVDSLGDLALFFVTLCQTHGFWEVIHPFPQSS